MIARITVWSNGTIMVFDENGWQMPDFQGWARDRLAAALDAATPETIYEIGDWSKGLVRTNPEALRAMLR